MPITDELGQRASARLGWDSDPDVPAFGAKEITFESWMDWLAQRHPYSSEAEWLRDSARFAELRGGIAEELRLAQASAEVEGLPGWFGELVDLMHWTQADVVTLNYDTLIEGEVEAGLRMDDQGATHSDDAVTGTPNSRGMFQAKSTTFTDRATLRLHKLHGSIDWYAVPGDSSGLTLERIDRQGDSERASSATIGGREVFIVPPTSTKNAYFDNPKTRYIWQQARAALSAAERVVLIGYSLPLTDVSMARMLHSTLSTGRQSVVIVNPDAASVAGRLGALGISSERVACIARNDCVARYVADEVERASEALVSRLQAEALGDGDSPVAIGWGRHDWGAITGTELSEDGTLTVEVDSVRGALAGISYPGTVTDGNGARQTITLRELLSKGTPKRIIAHGDGRTWPVIASAAPGRESAQDWVLLQTVGSSRLA